jgi:hypothetical protein
MRTTLLILALLTQACAYRSGATYTGNGDAGGNTLLSKWTDVTFGTDLENAEGGATGYKIARQNQSTVANQALKTGGQMVAAYVGADVIKSVTSSNNAVTTAESGNALKATQAKEVTKRAADANKTAVETAKIHAETLP